MKWYYYLHENGDLIGKNPVAYNESDFAGNDFVTKHWYIETEDRGDAWTLVIEAFALGARIDKIKDLIWKLEQIYNKEKEVYFGTNRSNEKGIHEVNEHEFEILLSD